MKKKSKLFTASAATVLIGSTFAGIVSADFADVKPKSSHYDAILALHEKDIISGFPDGTFRPNESVTRGQAAKMIVKAFDLAVLDPKNPNFSDVPTTHEYLPYIATLKSLGIISGYEDGTFAVDAPVTRAQMAKMISLAINLSPSDKHPFTDVPTTSAANSYIAALYQSGITTGTSSTTFSPTSPVTRGQLASFIVRAQKSYEQEDYILSILHTNDVHSRVEMYPKLYAAVEEQRAIRTNSLTLDAGDFSTGTLYFNEFLGEAELAMMNLIGYDAVTFGNHEFDLGSSADGHKALKNFVTNAKFPFVSANVNFGADSLFTSTFNDVISSKPQSGNIYSGIVTEKNGEKIGIFGLTTAETKDISSPGSIVFENYIQEAKKAVDSFEKLGIDKIVALTHIGYDDAPAIDNDQVLAKSVEGIDIIVGGHSHTQLDKPTLVATTATGAEKDPTLIIQAYQYADYLGTLDVAFDDSGVVTEYRGSLVKVADYAANSKAQELMTTFKTVIDEKSKEEIGVSLTAKLENPRTSDEGNTAGISVRSNETILGNLITDGMYNKAQSFSTTAPVIMAVQNGGGIRAAIDAGPITVGEVITVLPFGNTLALVNLTGAEIKEMFETSVRSTPKEDGGFLHVSGAKVVYDSSKPANEKVTSIQYKDASGKYVDIDSAANYVIATNAFTAKGGDGFTVLAKAYGEGRVTDLGLSDWENFRDHLKSLQTVPTTIEGRIIDSAKAAQ